MSEITDVRQALAAVVAPLAEQVKVAASTSKYETQTRQFVVRVLVGLPSEKTEAVLDDLLESAGETSVRQALEADPRLGGLARDTHVVSDSGHRLYPVLGSEPQLGADWTVEVRT